MRVSDMGPKWLLLLHFRLSPAKNKKLIVEARNVYRSQASPERRRGERALGGGVCRRRQRISLNRNRSSDRTALRCCRC